MAVKWALARSGGSCLALLTLVGSERSGFLNTDVKLVASGDADYGNLPQIITSSSGGSVFSIRWHVLRDYEVGNKVVYPCFKLSPRFREVCVFHQAFGGVGDVCDHEFFNVLMMMYLMTYSSLIRANGGMMGQLAITLLYYYVFVNTLPLKTMEKSKSSPFFERFIRWNGGSPENWGIGIDLISPREAIPAAPYNFGMPAHLPRAYFAYIRMQSMCNREDRTCKCQSSWSWSSTTWWGNLSITELIQQSANFQAWQKILPFSLSGHNWDSVERSNQLGRLKALGLTINFVMIKRLMNKNQINLDPKSKWPLCDTFCPMIDAGVIDNGPIVPAIADLSSSQACTLPTHVHVASSASTFGLFSYYLGHEKLDVFSGGGLNACPFADVSYCSTLSNLRELLKRTVSSEVLQRYTELSNSYSVWLPENQFLSSFCGDPIAYDDFKGLCRAKSYCSMVTSVIPSLKMKIHFTLQVINLIFSVLYLAPTALAKNFVHDFIPHKLISLPSFRNMAVWFPAFATNGQEKGGMPFFKAPGHALMDYLTFATVRLSPSLSKTKTAAFDLGVNGGVPCDYRDYLEISEHSAKSGDFKTRVID